MTAADPRGDDSRRLDLQRFQARLLYANLPLSALLSLLCAFLVSAYLSLDGASPRLNLWLAGMVTVQALRLLSARQFRAAAAASPQELRRWLRLFLLGTAAAGVLWGLLAGLLFPAHDPVAQSVLAIILAGLSGGAVTTLSVSAPAMLLFVLPALLPLAARFAAEGGQAGWVLAGLVGLFTAALLAIGRRAGITLRENEALRSGLERRERQLEQANLELSAVFDHVHQFFALLGEDGRIVRCNRRALELGGFSGMEQLVGTALVDGPWWEPGERAGLRALLAQALAGQPGHREFVLHAVDGRRSVADLAVSTLSALDGGAPQLVVAATDLTERIAAEAAIRSSEEKFRLLVERSLAGVYVIDGERFSYVNPVYAQTFGYTPEEVVGQLKVGDIVIEEQLPQVRENLRRRVAGEVDSLRFTFIGKHRAGHRVEVEVMGTRTVIDGKTVVIGTLLDITERRRSQRRVEHLANYDALTDLPNRRLLAEEATRQIGRALELQRPLAFMFLDLDRFKYVNDAFGHATGDQLLVQVGRRLQRCLRDEDMVARLGGDEFGFLLPETDVEAATVVARRVVDVLARPFELEGHLAQVGASIGIALVGPQEQDFDTLARCADIAMYRAKRRGNSYAFYVPGEAGEVTSRFALEGELRKALADGTIEVYYQPRINLETGRYDSVEALARWHHPEQGAISPGIFVAIAEESGQVGALGRHVMEVACRDLVAWRKRGIAVRMAVNLSVFELQDPDIVLRIARTLQHHRVDGSWLEIEVTESAAMSDPEANVATLEQLKALGIDLAIDDFGTGYSSLSYLKRLPADFLKIDRSFVDGVTQDDGRSIDADIVRAIIALAQSLELQVIAEGIEEAGQEQFLRRHGCQLAQGFYYCKPQPEAAMLAILEAQLEAGSAG